MVKRLGQYFILLLAISSLLFALSCGKIKLKSEPATTGEISDSEQWRQERRLTEEQLSPQELAARKADLRDRFVNENIHFEYDKSRLLLEAKEILKAKAEWLFMRPDVTVIIEGHCDERGTNEYNLALGDRRAESAKRFLVDLGIATGRITTVSYGEERPLDPQRNEKAWAKNRSDRFVIE